MNRSDQPCTVTLLTPLGEGGLAVVRLAGAGAAGVVEQIFQPHSDGPPGRLRLGRVVDPISGEVIDEGIASPLPGGPGVELSLHGGVRIVQRVVSACEQLGAQRLDARDPADQEALWQEAFALHQAGGVEHPALAADIELALPQARTRAAVEWLIAQANLLPRRLAALDRRRGERLLQLFRSRQQSLAGVRVAIVGPPNAGKSTLLNALAGREAAIVSDTPGTTRDYVSAWVNADGIAAEVIDTAGLRGQAEELESAAIHLARPVVQSADLVLEVTDSSQSPDGWWRETSRPLFEGLRHPPLTVLTKSDLPRKLDRPPGPPHPVAVSARTGQGLDQLRRAIRRALELPRLLPSRAGIFACRQANLLAGALKAPGEVNFHAVLRRITAGIPSPA